MKLLSLTTMPFPTASDEAWRDTPLHHLLSEEFEDKSDIHDAVDLNEVLKRYAKTGYRVVFLNGHLVLNDAENDLVVSQSYHHKKGIGDAFDVIRVSSETCIRVPVGRRLNKPLQLIVVSMGSSMSHHPYNINIVVDEGAKLHLKEYFIGLGAISYFNNVSTQCWVSPHAQFIYEKSVEESSLAYHLSRTVIFQAARSDCHLYHYSKQGRWLRNEWRIRLEGEEARCTVKGLYISQENEHHDLSFSIEHSHPRSHSQTLIKGLIHPKSKAIFRGRIFIEPQAQQVSASLSNKNILIMTPDKITGEVVTRPALAIFADDVKCTHGATVGMLDEAALFYLRARGLSLGEAQALLLESFVKDVVMCDV